MSIQDSRKVFSIGCWQVTPSSLTIDYEEHTHQLPAKVFQVLLLLVEAQGETVSHAKFYEQVWQGNENVAKKGLTNAIWHLRKIFDSVGQQQESIKTVSKAGYQLLLPTSQQLEVSPSSVSASNLLRYGAITVSVILVLVSLTWSLLSTDTPLVYSEPKNVTHFEGVEEYPSISPDGNWLAFSWEAQNGFGQLYIKSLLNNDDTLKQITFEASVHGSPAWSSNGMELAFTRINQLGECEVIFKDLVSGQEQSMSACYYERFHRGLDWARSGKYLVISDLTEQNTPALFRFEPDTNARQQISFPKRGEKDTQISIHPNSQAVAFIRTKDTLSDVYLIDAHGKEQRLTKLSVPIYGLAWTSNGEHLLINALHQESARTWQLNPATQAIKPLFKDGTAFNLATHSQENTVLYSRHRPIEQIVQRDNLGATKVSISSAGRDLYASVQGNNMTFISSRSGTFDIWHKNLATGKSTALTNNEGVVGTPVMLSKNMVVYPLKPNTESNTHVYLHDVTTNTRTKLFNDNFNYKHLSWNESLNTLLMSSDRSGDWQLWQFDLNTKQLTQVTVNGAGFGYLTSRGVFYSKENSQGIYHLNDQQETQVISTLQGEDWGNWQVTESGIYYVQRNQHTDSVYFYDFESQVSKEVFALNRNEIKRNRSLVVNEQGFFLTLVGAHQADIVKITTQSKL